MKAVVVTQFGGPDVMEWKEIDSPVPGPQQVLIRVAATSVNFADIKARYGQYHGGGTPPFVPGLDVAGVVERVGEAVTRLRPGQRVIAFPAGGSYAEYAVADEILTYPIPDSLDWEMAAAAPIVLFTAYHLLVQVARLQPGETVLVHAAAGGVGTTAIQLAKWLGAKTVIGTVGSDSKKEVALAAGADYVINYRTEDFATLVNELTDGKGADVILDSIAGEVLGKSLECLALYGRLAQFGIASGQPGVVRSNQLHANCQSVLGFSLGTTRRKRPERLLDTAAAVIPLLADGHIRMQIGKRFPLAEAAKAHVWVESRESTGKVLLIP